LPYPEGVFPFAYADDLALVVSGATEEEVMLRGDAAIRLISRFLTDAGLELTEEKTEAILMSGRRQLRDIAFRVNGIHNAPRDKVKYLGVWLDRNGTFLPHIEEAKKKALIAGAQLGRVMANVGGPRSSKRKCLASVLSSIALYAASLWAEALKYEKAKAMLNSVDRCAATRICLAYRTISTEAACVIAGIMPLRHRALEAEQRKSGKNRDLVREKAWKTWNAEWRHVETGAWTRRLIPDAQLWENRKHGEIDHWITQVLSGHGAIGQYLYRLKRITSPFCETCPLEEAKWAPQRRQCWSRCGNLVPETLVRHNMHRGSDEWKEVSDFVVPVLKAKAAEHPRSSR